MNIQLKRTQNAAGEIRLVSLVEPKTPDTDRIFVDMEKHCFPVFRQAAGNYGEYSAYLEHHGCACCSLTSVLAAYVEELRDITPAYTIEKIEPAVFGEEVWRENYKKSLRKQMPISMYGISKVLEYYQIPHRLIRQFQVLQAQKDIAVHLNQGKPVIIETRRIRKEGWWISSTNDKKYAGSYHTMVCVGLDEHGMVLFLDSAFRKWAGQYQRLKRAPLYDLLCYMFGKDSTQDQNVYFHNRKYSGGYILVEDRY